MIKTYELQQLTHSTYSVIIWSVSYENPIDSLAEIAEELATRKYKGSVIFDLLLTNGIAHNRFMEAYFDGARFNVNTFNIVKHGLDALRTMALTFYHNHLDYVEQSVLPKPVQFRIRKNIIV